MSKIRLTIASVLVGVLVYLSSWPVAIEPTAWQPTMDIGYVGAHQRNNQLDKLALIPTPAAGPEGLAVNQQQQLYFGLSNGDIGRLDGQRPEILKNTGGRPLGLRFDHDNNLYIADAYQGLLRLNSDGELQTLLTEVDGTPLIYANSLAISRDGTLYLSESSGRHSAKEHGTYEASLLDINEHRGSGRIIRYDPITAKAEVILTNLNFANGIELGNDDQSLFIAETGSYRVLRLHLSGPKQGQTDVLIDNLPGFPDNLSRASDGTYWLGLVSPRNALLDAVSNLPQLRKVIQRLPAAIRPQAVRYAHLVGFNSDGDIRFSLQGPAGHYGFVTGAERIGNTLYLSSLHEPAIGVLPLPHSNYSMRQ